MKLPNLFPLNANQKRFLLVLLCTIPAATLYCVLPRVGFPYPHILYTAIGGGLAIWYTIYNRGFCTRGKEANDLNPELPLAERERLIADGKSRAARSAWALYVILPMLFTLLIDTIALTLFQNRSFFS